MKIEPEIILAKDRELDPADFCRVNEPGEFCKVCGTYLNCKIDGIDAEYHRRPENPAAR